MRRVSENNFKVYGANKIWRQLLRKGIRAARCTVERLMKKLGIQGIRRGKKCWTTIADNMLDRPTDKVNRQFVATRPNQLWVADITFVATWTGFVYVSFITDVLRDVLFAGASAVHGIPIWYSMHWNELEGSADAT
ncbi:IS3 family transposase [Nitrosomonas sp.]|uniref:IS3 family transposase n=1 Tax=Nitrosomonas sp. TaxID=42353 RepID=UPI0025FA3B29|nr:IS3 family transposase [Nitrosomonas sp.]